jgi:acyl carrier protein
MALEDVFARILRVPVANITDASNPSNLRRWDSMRHMELVTALETEYRVEFTVPEIQALTSVGTARTMLRAKNCDV